MTSMQRYVYLQGVHTSPSVSSCCRAGQRRRLHGCAVCAAAASYFHISSSRFWRRPAGRSAAGLPVRAAGGTAAGGWRSSKWNVGGVCRCVTLQLCKVDCSQQQSKLILVKKTPPEQAGFSCYSGLSISQSGRCTTRHLQGFRCTRACYDASVNLAERFAAACETTRHQYASPAQVSVGAGPSSGIDAETAGRIAQIRDVLPDYGDGFLAAALQVCST